MLVSQDLLFQLYGPFKQVTCHLEPPLFVIHARFFLDYPAPYFCGACTDSVDNAASNPRPPMAVFESASEGPSYNDELCGSGSREYILPACLSCHEGVQERRFGCT